MEEDDDTHTEVEFDDSYQSMLLDDDDDDMHDTSLDNSHDAPLSSSPPSSPTKSVSDLEAIINGCGSLSAAIDDTSDTASSNSEDDSDGSSSDEDSLAPALPIILSLTQITKTVKDRAHERQQTLIRRGRQLYKKHLADDKERKKKRVSVMAPETIDMESMRRDREKMLQEQESKLAFRAAVLNAGKVQGDQSVFLRSTLCSR